MSRNRQVIRLWRIVLRLDGRVGATLQELADALAVTTRTIRRDLEALEEAGFPLVDEIPEGTAARRWRVYDWRKEAA
jgi:predicted DNA-binding transcriptional regulator YafY